MSEDTAVAVQRRREVTVPSEALAEAMNLTVNSLDGGKLERWSVRLPLLAHHQYLSPGRRIPPDQLPDVLRGTHYRNDASKLAWGNEYSATVRAEGYFWLNKVGIVSFHTPETVPNRDGIIVPNPIHTQNYALHREVAIGYAETGQMVMYVDDLEIDFIQAWEAERLRKLASLLPKPARKRGGRDQSERQVGGWDDEVDDAPAPTPAPSVEAAAEYLVRDDYGRPKLGEFGELLFRLPDNLEVEAMDRLMTLRNYGPRMAKTIARRRILTEATGLRTLWTRISIERPTLEREWVSVVGWRDQMTPDERLARAQSEAKQVFGDSTGKVTEDELDFTEAEYREAEEVERTDVKVDPDAPVTVDVKAQAAAGRIPGVTVGMPGERVSKQPCGAIHEEWPDRPCTRAAGHCNDLPHESEGGIWPCAKP